MFISGCKWDIHQVIIMYACGGVYNTSIEEKKEEKILHEGVY